MMIGSTAFRLVAAISYNLIFNKTFSFLACMFFLLACSTSSDVNPWSNAVSKKIDQDTYGEPWPFKKYSSGTLICVPGITGKLPGSPDKRYQYIVFTPDGFPERKYALNGTALDNLEKEGFFHSNNIRKRDSFYGLANTSHLIADGLSMCEK